MAELTYRDAVARGIAQEMTRDPDVVFLGEDVGKAGGVFKATVGLFEQFGPLRVRDTPISEQAILGAAMGAAMTGLKPIAEIMFSDFFAVCFDYIANEFAKSPMTSRGDDGATTFRPGIIMHQFSTLCECCAPKREPAPLPVRMTSGHLTWPFVM